MQQKSELPEGWETSDLGSLISIASGKYIKREDYSKIPDQPYPVAGAGGPIGYTDSYNFTSPIITLGRVGAAGALTVYKKNAWVTDNTLVIKPNSQDLFNWLIRYFQTVDWISIQTGSSQPLITQKIVKALTIPLPPLAEQHRIVTAIEALFARLDAAQARLDRVPGILQQFRQAVLAAACDGRLTEDWRAEHPNIENSRKYLEITLNTLSSGKKKIQTPDTSGLNDIPDKWCWATIEQLASPEARSIQSGPFGSNLLHSEFQDSGILAIGIDNVQNGFFSYGKEHRISPEKYEELRKYTARPLDLLITVMATIGRCCVFPENCETAIITKHVYRITSNQDLVSPHYLFQTLRGAIPVQQQIQNQIRGQTRPGINGTILKSIAIPLPPIPEQDEIVHRADALFALADQIEARVATAKERTETLRQSILTQAFSGQLVPTEAELAQRERREYEPALVLLERIKSSI
ncbi:restriction endonuclease subunit S [Methanocalculus sp.]|uniref:restriction endonuclease subunit S n=1 Tax=Methanocalculus sp. TaxID=2004547 RepID=UPI00262459BC|nr:restriction endonuclease subunit S [Methanocalculus sp.]MDG6249442.1 restriction endonuclease subunit S [Methanocalculus sp.]